MGDVLVDATEGRTAADVVHARMTATPATATVAEVREYFAGSGSRRLAVLADELGHYAGMLTPEDLEAADDPSAPAADFARPGTTVFPDDPAELARDLALAAESRRVPVVHADGRLLGVVALDERRERFCGTG